MSPRYCPDGEDHKWVEWGGEPRFACCRCGKMTDKEPEAFLPVDRPNDEWTWFSIFDEWYKWIADEGACPTCRANDGATYEPGTEDHLPPEDCTCVNGCRCHYMSVPNTPESAWRFVATE